MKFPIHILFYNTEHPPECEGAIKRHGCSANYNTDTHECKIPNVFGEILNVSIFNMVSKDASCKYYAPGNNNNNNNNNNSDNYDNKEQKSGKSSACLPYEAL